MPFGNTTEVVPTCTNYRNATRTGRIQITLCNVNSSCAFYTVVPYGWTNGNECQDTANRTNSLTSAAIEQLNALPPLPTIILGNLNASTSRLQTIQDLLNDGWIDVGHHANIWNRTADAQHALHTTDMRVPLSSLSRSPRLPWINLRTTSA